MRKILTVFQTFILVLLSLQLKMFAQCTTSWINPSGGSWNTASNWSNGVPNSESEVCITLNGTYTITIDNQVSIKSFSLGGTSGTQTLVLNSSLNLAGNSTISSRGVMQWNSNAVQGIGTITNNGTITASTTDQKYLSVISIINNNIVNIDAPIQIQSSAGITNSSTGTINLMNGAYPSQYNTGRIVNKGTLKKTGSGTIYFGAQLTNEGGTLQVDSGILRFISEVNLSGGSYTAASGAALVLASAYLSANGKLSGSPAGDIIFESGTFTATGSEATFNFSGTGFQWQGGSLSQNSGSWANEGKLFVNGSDQKYLQSTLTNKGSIEFSSRLQIQNSGIIINNAGKTITLVQGAYISQYNTGWIINRGTILKSGSGTIIYTAQLRNEGGTLRCSGGTFQFSYQTDLVGGTYDAAAGDSLVFNSSYLTAKGTLNGSPAGTVLFTGGNFSADSTEAVLNLQGSGFTWTAGALQQANGGSWVNQGKLLISGADIKYLSAAGLINRGTIDISGILQIQNSSNMTNESGKTLTLLNGAAIYQYNTGWIINAGTLKKSGDSTVSFSAYLRNDEGTLNADKGTLRFSSIAELNGGSYTASAGAVLAFSTTNIFIKKTLSGNPAGTVIFEAGTLYADEPGAVFNINGSGFQWLGGSLAQRNGGSFINSGKIIANGQDQKYLQSVSFTNKGAFDLNGPLQLQNSSDFINDASGVFKIYDGISLSSYNNGNFINSGRFEKQGTATAFVSASFTNAAGGILTGSGSCSISLQNNKGIIEPGTTGDKLTWNGNLRMDSLTSMLKIDLGSSTSYSQLFVTGNASLKGILSAAPVNNFVPVAGQVFTVLKAQNISGLFDSLQSLTFNNISLYPNINDTSVVLSAAQGVPKLAANISVTPSSTANGGVVTFLLNGTGFAPDDIIYLICNDCKGSDISRVIKGKIKQMTSTSAAVQFDLTDPFITGSYNLAARDPRGGLAAASVTINAVTTSKPAIRVFSSVKNASEKGPLPGVIVFEINTPSSKPLDITYKIEGTASPYQDYFTSTRSDVITIPAGKTEASLEILPLPDNIADGNENVNITLIPSDAYILSSSSSATIIIDDGPPPATFQVYTSTPGKAGNNGTITVTVAGQKIKENASAVLTGTNTVQPASVYVNKEGTMLVATFDLTGIPAGRVYKIRVDNKNGETAELPNALTVEKAIEPEISVTVIGPSEFRSFLPPQQYVAAVTNRGNVDAIAVPVFISVANSGNPYLEPLFDVINIKPQDFEEGITEGFPGWDKLKLVEDWGNRKVIAVILPVVQAGETITLPFLARSYNIKVWTNPVSQPYVPNIPGQFNSAGSQVNTWTGVAPKDIMGLSKIAVDPNQLQDCLISLAGLAAALVPGGECITALGRAGASLAAAGVKTAMALDQQKYTRATLSYSSFMYNLAMITYTCLKEGAELATGWGFFAGLALPTIGVLSDCLPLLKEPDQPGKDVNEIRAHDPNDKIGPDGSGDMLYTSGIDAAGYMIRFENDTAATAPAVLVNITDRIDKDKFDLSTFTLGSISFGERIVSPPAGLKQWSTTVTIPGVTKYVVKIIAGLNEETGVAAWQLMAVDPVTGQYPSDANAGFLPPNDNPPHGQGNVFFTIKPKDNLPSGTRLCNEASIVFDANDPIVTPEWCNTLDFDVPSSKIEKLPSVQRDTSFTVSWAGTDITSGVSEYLLFVSTNNGPYKLWTETSATSAKFTGKQDSTYAFYSIARDNAGNLEKITDSADAVTKIDFSTGVEDENTGKIPAEFALQQNYPNPFNPSTIIRFDLPEESDVTLEVFNILGQKIATLVKGNLKAGYHEVSFDAHTFASGNYFYRIKAGSFVQVRKMLLVK